MPRESTKGNRIFDRIQAMRAEDANLTQQGAFALLAQETGEKPQSIGANYYRVARNRSKNEAAERKAARDAARAQRDAERGMEPQPVRKAINRSAQVNDSLDEMATVLHRQIDTLVEQYKAEHERLTRVRELVGG